MHSAALLAFDRSRARHSDGQPVFADAPDVARRLKPEEPVFLFSPLRLLANARHFLQHFPGETAFAVKSNASPDVLLTLARAGIKVWDVASVQEMADVRAVAPKGQFHYHNPVKSRSEIRVAAKKYGVRRFAADCAEEIAKIATETRDIDGIEIAIRFVLPRENAASAHDFTTKFGATEAEAAGLLKLVAAHRFAPVLTFHPGSQCTEPQAYARHIHAAARIAMAADVQLAALNVGGGFPARYVQSKGAELGDYFALIARTACQAFDDNAPKIECEPGRGLVASSTSLLAQVKLVRAGRGDVFLTDGIYGALMEVSQAPALRPPHRVIRDGAEFADDLVAMTVFGPTCDPLDRLPGEWTLPAGLREGDYVEFGTLGAYGRATMTEFNGYGGHRTVIVDRVLGI